MLVVSKLVYRLAGTWLGIAEQRRVDAFQNYCLRRILKIPAAYYYRVRNVEVLDKAAQEPLSSTILKMQLRFFGQIFRLPTSDPLRTATFFGQGLRPATAGFVRKPGRPRHTWAEQLLKHAARVAGNENLEQRMHNEELWRRMVQAYTF